MSEEKPFEEKLREWQQKLNLQDWEITAEVTPPALYEYRRNDDGKDSDGFNDIFRYYRKSVIDIREGIDDDFILLHELAHIIVDPLDSGYDQAISMVPSEDARKVLRGNRRYALEVVVNHLARIFLGRGKRLNIDQDGEI